MKEKRYNSTIIREYDQQLIFDALSLYSDGEIAIVWDRLLVRQLGMVINIFIYFLLLFFSLFRLAFYLKKKM